jgi:hypothetical protein
MRRCDKSGNEIPGAKPCVIETGAGEYVVDQVVRRTSKLDGSKYYEKCVEVIVPTPAFVPFQGMQQSSTYPMMSDALSCGAMQAREFHELARSQGITGISYDSDGNCHIADRTSRRKWMAYREMHDRNGGYSDG